MHLSEPEMQPGRLSVQLNGTACRSHARSGYLRLSLSLSEGPQRCEQEPGGLQR